jgi:hypothetical protein
LVKKIELGGGTTPRGQGFVNVDRMQHPLVDVVLDLERDPLPFEDDSVDEVYCAHALEYFDYLHALHEIARVSRVGAKVTIIAAHWLSESARAVGRKHALPPQQIQEITKTALAHYWSGHAKRLALGGLAMRPSPELAEMRTAFPFLSDEQLLRWIPGAAGEVCYELEVVANDSEPAAAPTRKRPRRDGALEVSLVTVLYRPDWDSVRPRIAANVHALKASEIAGELVVLDNSPEPTAGAQEWLAGHAGVPFVYHWFDGHNLYLAGALTKALGLAKGECLVYFCSSHGLVNDPTWLADIIAPLAEKAVGIAGNVRPCEYNRVAAVPEDIIEPQIHVQGGVWAARRDVLAKIGFGHRFPFEFLDVDLSRRLQAAGYKLADVPGVKSVAGGRIPDAERYKYVHDYR